MYWLMLPTFYWYCVDDIKINKCVFASFCPCLFAAVDPSTPAGNSNNLFSIDRQSGLVTRGPKALDRETSSSHVLEVEAYNSDEGSMRSSVRVRRNTTSQLLLQD